MIKKWRCSVCGDVVVSDSKKSHQMDWCKCGESALDLEEGYMRTLGYCTFLGNLKKSVDKKI